MAKILFTGGGSAGHVTPNLALIEEMRSRGWDLLYLGSETGIEKEIVARSSVPYFAIKTGKLRRYFSWANFIDPFLVFWGFAQSLGLCFKHKPQVIFSKGGFVSVPVILAGAILRIPVIAHESDTSPGLATRICLPFCKKLCVNFEETRINHPKVVVTGSPMRQDILKGDAEKGRRFLGLSEGLPVLLVFGGSLGAKSINQVVRKSLHRLLEHFLVVHICGETHLHDDLDNLDGYIQKEYVHQEFGDVLACADIVIARAGANSIYELLVTRKPNLLIPLSSKASRGDQIQNAEIFRKAGYCMVIQEEELSSKELLQAIYSIQSRITEIKAKLSEFEVRDSVGQICQLIERAAG